MKKEKNNFIKQRLLPLLACAVLLCSMFTVFVSADDYTVSGVWEFNDDITSDGDHLFEVDFVSYLDSDYFAISIWCPYDDSNISMLYVDDLDTEDGLYVYGDCIWHEENCNTIDFGATPQTVSQEFYTWLTANAKPNNDNGIFSVFSNTATWIATSTQNMIPMFYTADTGLTFVGCLTIAALAFSVAFLVISLVSRFLSFRG